jgi:hypothetical protein
LGWDSADVNEIVEQKPGRTCGKQNPGRGWIVYNDATSVQTRGFRRDETPGIGCGVFEAVHDYGFQPDGDFTISKAVGEVREAVVEPPSLDLRRTGE